jgi:DIS3-like exonuclease 1
LLNFFRFSPFFRDVVNDTRRNSIIFINENFTSTFTERSHQSIEERNQTAVIKVAAWYQSHLDPKSNIHVVFVSENDAVLERAAKEAKVKTQKLGQYVQNYLPKYPDLYELYESLATLAEQDEAGEGSAPAGYEEYKPDDVLDSAVKSGMFYRGKIQVGRHGSEEAWVRIDEKAALGKDILIPDRICRNRAFHGDVVAVELLDRRFWGKTGDDGSTENSDQPCGKVVGVFKRNWRSYVCTIQEEDVQNAKPDKTEWVVAVPWDFRIPKIRIKTRQTKEIGNCRIVVRVDRWDADSNYPQGHYVRTLGEIGKLETEMQVLMQENGIQYSPFSQHMLSELPEHTPEKPWAPSSEELAKRRDCRSWRVFSIDPLGSQDIDDALSVNVLPNGNYELGCRTNPQFRLAMHLRWFSYSLSDF